MAVQLLLGLGKSLASSATRKAALGKVKKLAKDKLKSAAEENKKLKSKSLEDKKSKSSTESEDQDSSFSRSKKSTLASDLKIKSAPSTEPQIVQLKINVSNIRSFLVQQNSNSKKLQKERKRSNRETESRRKILYKERKLKLPPFGKSAKNIIKSVASSGNILSNLLDFVGLIILGILTNALPAIIKKVQEVIDNVVNFLTPIQSGFNLISAFFTGTIDEPKYDVDRKRIDDTLANWEKDGGLVDQFATKMGPLEGIIKSLKPVVFRFLREKVGGQKTVLAKEGGKEGFYNIETEKFTEKQWTTSEREKFESGGGGSVGTVSGTTSTSGGTTSPSGSTDANNISGFPITSHYGGRWGTLHGGIDVGTPTGTAIALAKAGKVMYSSPNHGGYGGIIDAWVPSLNVQFRFAHLIKQFVKTGDTFKAGEILGQTGGGAGDPGKGSSTGPHLHYEIDTQKNGTTYGGAKNRNLLYDMAKYVILGSASQTSSGEGGNLIPPIKGNLPENEDFAQILEPQLSENVYTYYYLEPHTTIQTQVVPIPIKNSKGSMTKQEVEHSILWGE